MSSFVVHTEHIHVMIWAGLKRTAGPSYPLRWFHGNPERVDVLDVTTVDNVGRMLLAANVAAVNSRYNEDSAVQDYQYRRPQQTSWSAGELLNAIHCYEYQASDDPDWTTTEAYQFCRALERHIMNDVPDYTNGPWAITPNALPAAQQRREAAIIAHQRR
ncbi:hypothetical protein [[Mycobacterium] nativiensis]|uniref:Uncharacterized protein n=1 Tax=[Mycobacterium] nativiensis TaxID=2855503 RepID=A0ABU5Y4J9_9MYCO|nr:hypothetical protein [Mycolicibacter sp. MYC340]MEB3035149.1 hypothetical protein [Mycolicibacter sp. MYC340]